MNGTLKGYLTNAIDKAAEVAQGVGDWVSTKAQGLRGTATPAPEPTVERPLSGAARSARDGMEYSRNMGADAFKEVPGNARTWTADSQGRVATEYGPSEGLRGPASQPNPAWREGMSPEARAYQASRASPYPPAQPTGTPAGPTASTGGLRGFARSAAGKLGIAGTALAATDAGLKASEGDTPEQRQGLSTAQGFGTELYDTLSLGQGRRFAHGVKRAIGAFPALRSDAPEDQPGRYPSGLRGIAARFGAGWDEGNALEQRARAAQPGAPAPQPATNGQPPIEGGGSLIPVNDGEGGRARPDALLGSSLIPATGQGAFRRTTPGNEGPATAVSSPGASPAENSYVASDRKPRGVRDAAIAPQPGVFGEIANMQGLRQSAVAERMRQHDAQQNARLGVAQRGQDVAREGHILSADTARSRLAYEQGVQNRENFGKRLTAAANADVPAASAGVLGTEKGAQQSRDALVKQRADTLRERFEYSVGDRADGRRVEQLNPTEQNLLMDGNKYLERANASRDTWGSFFRNFFGDKQFDSKNVYSYIPKSVEPSALGGYIVHFGNGNQATVPDVAGGGFNLTKPNDPVDADVMARVAALIREHKAKGAK